MSNAMQAEGAISDEMARSIRLSCRRQWNSVATPWIAPRGAWTVRSGSLFWWPESMAMAPLVPSK